MNPIVKRIMISGAAACLLIAGLFLYAIGRTPQIETTKHLPHVDWLPTEASDITYAQSDGFGWFQSYECTISREALDKLALKEGWKLEAKDAVFASLRSVLGLPALREFGGTKMDLVPKALFYEDRKPNGGGVTVIYDLELGRLFVHKSHR
jgi:hypothetical protein